MESEDRVPEIKNEKENIVSASKANSSAEKPHNHTLLVVGVVLIVLIAGGSVLTLGRGMIRHPRGQVVSQVRQNRGFQGMGGRRGNMMRADFNGINISGKITKIDGDNMVVNNGKDNTVVIADSTSIVKSGSIISKTDLKVDDQITVSGTANSSGQYTATMIRVR